MTLPKSLTYVAESPSWFKKMMIGGLVSAIPLVSAIANGYQIQTLRNILNQRPQALPEWDNIGGYLKDGIRVTGAKYLLNAPHVILGVLIAIVDLINLQATIISWAMFFWHHLYAWFTNSPVAPSYSGSEIEGMSLLGWVALAAINGIWLSIEGVILLTLPVMVLRCAQNAPFLSLFNIFSHARFIFLNLRPYLFAQIANLVIASVFSSLAATVGGIGFVTVIVPLLSYYVYAIGKFWRRLIWAHVLAEAGFAEMQGAAMRGREAGTPSGISGAVILAGIFVALTAAILGVLLLVIFAAPMIFRSDSSPPPAGNQPVSERPSRFIAANSQTFEPIPQTSVNTETNPTSTSQPTPVQSLRPTRPLNDAEISPPLPAYIAAMKSENISYVSEIPPCEGVPRPSLQKGEIYDILKAAPDLILYEKINVIARRDKLQISDVRHSPLPLQLLGLAVFAHRGMGFRNTRLRQFFQCYPWYTYRLDYDDSDLTVIDLYNLEVINQVENEKK